MRASVLRGKALGSDVRPLHGYQLSRGDRLPRASHPVREIANSIAEALRLGEFARPYLIRTPGKVRATAAMASVVVERVLDGLMVAILLIVLLLRVPLSGPNIERVRAGGYTMFAFFLALLAFLVLAYWQHGMALRLARATIGRVAPALCERLCTLLDAFIGGLKALPSASRQLAIVALTALYWGINGFGMMILAYAFGIHLSLVEAYTVLGVLVIGVMLPAGPGMAGTFQFFCQLGLSLFMAQTDEARATAAAYANVLWGAQFVQQVGLGLLFLAFRSDDLAAGHRVTLGELMNAEEVVEEDADDKSEPPAPPVAHAVLDPVPEKPIRAARSPRG